MVRPFFAGLVLTLSAFGALGEPVDPDRVAIQRGSFDGCVDKMPPEVRAHFGRLATERFCSCYASKIADTITPEQMDAMLKADTLYDIPGYAETMRSARLACERQHMARWD